MTGKKLLSALAGVVLLGLIVWGLWKATRPQPLPIQGEMEARTIDVASKVPGRVLELKVEEGQQVKAGDVLFRLESPEIDAKLAQASAAHEAAESVSAKAKAGAREQEIRMAEYDWKRASSGAELAETTAQRVGSLYKEGLIAQQKYDEATTQARASRALADAAKAQYDMALSGARKEDRAAADAQARQAQGAVSEVEAYRKETAIMAPSNGEVSKVQIHVGELAPQGFPVVTLVDRSDTWAVINLREDELPRFKQGSEFDAEFPALGKTLRLKVTWLSPHPDFATWKSVRGTQGVDLRTFEMRAHVLSPPPELRPGMSVIVRR
jgi:HlyD family secretion protein